MSPPKKWAPQYGGAQGGCAQSCREFHHSAQPKAGLFVFIDTDIDISLMFCYNIYTSLRLYL